MKRTMVTSLVAVGLAAGGVGMAAAQDSSKIQAFVILPVNEAASEGFMTAMRDNVVKSRQEPGNRGFHVFRAEDGGPTIYLIERWKDQAALDAHLQTAHLKAVIDAFPTVLDSGPTIFWLDEIPEIPAAPSDRDVVTPRNVVVMFETSEETRALFLDAMANVMDRSRVAPGNVGFDLFQVHDAPNRFILVERWASTGDHEAHLEADYSAQLSEALDGLLVANPMDSRWLLTELDVAVQ